MTRHARRLLLLERRLVERELLDFGIEAADLPLFHRHSPAVIRDLLASVEAMSDEELLARLHPEAR